jgi:hypothetical protein
VDSNPTLWPVIGNQPRNIRLESSLVRQLYRAIAPLHLNLTAHPIRSHRGSPSEREGRRPVNDAGQRHGRGQNNFSLCFRERSREQQVEELMKDRFVAELQPFVARLSEFQLRAILSQVHNLTLRRST